MFGPKTVGQSNLICFFSQNRKQYVETRGAKPRLIMGTLKTISAPISVKKQKQTKLHFRVCELLRMLTNGRCSAGTTFLILCLWSGEECVLGGKHLMLSVISPPDFSRHKFGAAGTLAELTRN